MYTYTYKYPYLYTFQVRFSILMRCSRHRYVLAWDLQTDNRTVPAQTSNSRVNTLLVHLSSKQSNFENQSEYIGESKLRPPSYFMDVWGISARTRNVCVCVCVFTKLVSCINCLNFRIVVIEPYERERFKSIQPGVEKTREDLQTFHISIHFQISGLRCEMPAMPLLLSPRILLQQYQLLCPFCALPKLFFHNMHL